MMAGPITGAPTCHVSFSMITMHCICSNFPRTHTIQKAATPIVVADSQGKEELTVFFTTSMGPTVFTVTEPAIDGVTTIAPKWDGSSNLTFSRESVLSMM